MMEIKSYSNVQTLCTMWSVFDPSLPNQLRQPCSLVFISDCTFLIRCLPVCVLSSILISAFLKYVFIAALSISTSHHLCSPFNHMSIVVCSRHYSLPPLDTLYYFIQNASEFFFLFWHPTFRVFALTTFKIPHSLSSFILMILSDTLNLHNTMSTFFLQEYPTLFVFLSGRTLWIPLHCAWFCFPATRSSAHRLASSFS